MQWGDWVWDQKETVLAHKIVQISSIRDSAFILLNILQIGIVSMGKGCGDPRYPGLYTRVSSLMTWLKETTAGYTIWDSNCKKIVS